MWLVLQAAKVPLNEYEFPTSKVANVQSQLEKLVAKNYYLHSSARDAYRFALQTTLPLPVCCFLLNGVSECLPALSLQVIWLSFLP